MVAAGSATATTTAIDYACVAPAAERRATAQRSHPHGDVERLNHQSGSGVTVSAGQELSPELPPALVREEVTLVEAMHQGPRLSTQAIDQVLQIYPPGSNLAISAIGDWELAGPVATEVGDQSTWCNRTATWRPIRLGGTE